MRRRPITRANDPDIGLGEQHTCRDFGSGIGGDALHLAMAKRQSLTIASADQGLIKAAEALGLPFQLITAAGWAGLPGATPYPAPRE